MELIERNKHEAKRLGQSIRESTRKDMKRRRGVFSLYMAAAASMCVVALYQMGILKRVPEPPVPQLNSTGITGSAKAYSLLATPDAVLAIGSYATTMTLAAMGPPDRAIKQPLIPLALAAKVGLDAVVAAKYTMTELKEHRSACFWCLIASAAVFASLPLVMPEARRSMRKPA